VHWAKAAKKAKNSGMSFTAFAQAKELKLGTLRKWIEELPAMEGALELSRTSRTLGKRRRVTRNRSGGAKFPELEAHVYRVIKERRQAGLKVRDKRPALTMGSERLTVWCAAGAPRLHPSHCNALRTG
jgi:hypothetical protein